MSHVLHDDETVVVSLCRIDILILMSFHVFTYRYFDRVLSTRTFQIECKRRITEKLFFFFITQKNYQKSLSRDAPEMYC